MEFKKGEEGEGGRSWRDVEGEGEEGGGRRLLISHRCVLNLSRTASVTSRSRRSSESFVIAAREGFVGGRGETFNSKPPPSCALKVVSFVFGDLIGFPFRLLSSSNISPRLSPSQVFLPPPFVPLSTPSKSFSIDF